MSTEILETVDAVMAALGGNQHVAGLTASKPSAVSMWKKAGSFPSNQFVVMTEALRAIGKSAPLSLWGMNASKSHIEKESAS